MSTDEPALAPVLLDWDDDSFVDHWNAVELFVLEHGPEVAADHAAGWLRGRDIDRYALGIDVLVCLARLDRGSVRALHAAALEVLESGEPELRWVAAHALGVVPKLSVAPMMLRLVVDDDPAIRWLAVSGLADLASEQELPADHEVVRVLVRAMDDPDHEVQRWAVYSVARVVEADSAEIRSALATHLDGRDEEFAADACIGLALRGDARVDDILMAQLLHVGVDVEYLEAATERAQPAFLPLLLALRDEPRYSDGEEWFWAATLDEAITACSHAAR